MSFANRLHELRRDRGLSQEDLAARVGTKGPAIGRYERGDATPTIKTATKLARALDVSLDYLTALTDHVADPDTRARLEAITALPDEDRRFVLRALDSLVRDTRVQKAYAA